MKPRSRLCWLCGRKFRGNHFIEVEIDEHPRELHKECASNPKFQLEMKGYCPTLPTRPVNRG